MPTVAQPFSPTNAVAGIADFIGDPVQAARFPEHYLRFRNDRAALDVGLANLADEEWIAHFGRFEPFEGSLRQPLALRYHGHQFRVYNPDIGDGRGFLFAQMHDARGRLMDFGTKGSGQTPYSRVGDGRLTLKGGVREILATEMLEALGVATSRTFSLIETGEALHRGDEPSPTRSAVLVRLSHGHIRIGSFQRLAALGLNDELGRLTQYCLKHYFQDQAGDDGPVRLLRHVVAQTADLAASYMVAGFVHGVLNSDNINVTGESFDYGPWRFTPTFDPGFTAAYFDQSGLYSFGRQTEAIYWDVTQLAISLRALSDTEPLIAALDDFAPAYQEGLLRRMLSRLGVKSDGSEADTALVKATEQALVESQVPIDRFFFDWRGGRSRKRGYDQDAFAPLRAMHTRVPLAGVLDHEYWSDDKPCGLAIEEVEAIWAPIAANDDWTMLHDKVAAIRRMGEAMENRSGAA